MKEAAGNVDNATFRDLFVHNPVPMFIYRRSDMRILEGNEAAAQQYGYARSALLDKTVHALLVPEDRWRLAEGQRAPHTGGFVRVGLRRHARADGSALTVEVSRLDLSFFDIDAALIVAVDVTERINATRKLEETQLQLAAAQRISGTGSIDRNLLTGEVVWSAEALRLFGLKSGASAPSREAFLALFHPDDRERFAAFVIAGERGQNPAPMKCRIVPPVGGVRWILNVSDTVFDEAGRATRRIGTFQDVTEVHQAYERQQKLEQSLRAAIETAEEARREVVAANTELERRVEARTEELRQAQLTLIAQERLSALGQLTATVAHEMRNPLSAINNTIFVIDEMARTHNLPIERTVRRMKRSIERCENIIADLLDFTRASEPKLVAIRLDEWLMEVLDEQAEAPGIALERELDAVGAMVSIDQERFRSVLINLIENAVQAIEGAECTERRISVSTLGGPEPQIRVTDTGPGIPGEILPRIFEPLFSTKSFGTGLGLATVRQIIGQHGGAITVESKPGRTTFLIRLPAAGLDTVNLAFAS